MEKYIRLYEVIAYYKDEEGNNKTFFFLSYGDEESFSDEHQNFYKSNKGNMNITNYHVDIYEGTYPVTYDNEFVYYEANEISNNCFTERYNDLELLIDKIKYEFDDYDYNDIISTYWVEVEPLKWDINGNKAITSNVILSGICYLMAYDYVIRSFLEEICACYIGKKDKLTELIEERNKINELIEYIESCSEKTIVL